MPDEQKKKAIKGFFAKSKSKGKKKTAVAVKTEGDGDADLNAMLDADCWGSSAADEQTTPAVGSISTVYVMRTRGQHYSVRGTDLPCAARLKRVWLGWPHSSAVLRRACWRWLPLALPCTRYALAHPLPNATGELLQLLRLAYLRILAQSGSMLWKLRPRWSRLVQTLLASA